MVTKPPVTPPGAIEIIRLNASMTDLAGMPEDGYRYEMLGGVYLQDKAHLYLAAGTSLVWVVWPDSRTIDVWTPPAQSATLGLHDDLDGGVVFPGLVIPVAANFP